MSEVFEGIVMPVAEGQTVALPAKWFATAAVGQKAAAVYRIDQRDVAAFEGEIDHLAAELSKSFGKALVVRYDSRVGHRSSVFFRDGAMVCSYGEDDELFVPLDVNGAPITIAPPIKRADFSEGEEYETMCNAIQLGLVTLGVGEWNLLFELMTS